MKSLIDMHIHTSYSDGAYEPMEIVNLAVKKRLKTIAITDHDTINGTKLINRSHPLIVGGKIEVINGIELTAKNTKGNGRMHILGYGVDLDNDELHAKTEAIRKNNVIVTLAIYEQIKKDYGICFSDEDIETLKTATHNVGRPDLAKLCVKYGYAAFPQEAFDKYLNSAHAKVKRDGISKGLDWCECIKLIRKSGGVPVLAHPKTLELPKYRFDILLKGMIVSGLQGIEVYHSSHTKEEIEKYLALANNYGLLVSGGSDYHGGDVKTDVKLGSGRNGNLKIKSLSLVDYLHERGEKNGKNIQ